MRIALLMDDNSYAGREYLSKLYEFNFIIEAITVGKKHEIDIKEEERCGGHWKPTSQIELKKHFNFINFESLKSPELYNYLSTKQFDLCIQGGTGILNDNIINSFTNGILNFHPGFLPYYRGCSAPEWQLLENRDIISTCHFIDSGIDTGPILMNKILEVNLKSYELFRASIYPLTAIFVSEVIKLILEHPITLRNVKNQNHSEAIYRKYIGDEKILYLKSLLAK